MSATVPGPPVLYKSNPSQIHPLCTDQAIEFFWSPPDTDGGSSILSYTLECPEASFNQTYSSSTFYAKVTGLTNGVSYTFTIKATNAIGNSSTATYRTVQTGSRPSAPRNGTVLNKTTTHISIGWNVPSSDGGASIKWYVIKAISSNSSDPVLQESAYSTDRSITIYGLNSGSNYILEVYAVNDIGYSLPFTITPVNGRLLVSFLASTYSGSGAWNDDSGNGYNATLQAGTAAKNAAGNGIVLDGSTSWLFPNIGYQVTFSLSVWFKLTAIPNVFTWLVTELQGSSGGPNMMIQIDNTGAANCGFVTSGQGVTGAGLPLPLNEWHNIVVTWDTTDIKTYYDGSLYNTTTPTNYNYTQSSGLQYRIGADFFESTFYTNGELGALKIYSYALTSTEVSDYYNSTVSTYPNV